MQTWCTDSSGRGIGASQRQNIGLLNVGGLKSWEKIIYELDLTSLDSDRCAVHKTFWHRSISNNSGFEPRPCQILSATARYCTAGPSLLWHHVAFCLVLLPLPQPCRPPSSPITLSKFARRTQSGDTSTITCSAQKTEWNNTHRCQRQFITHVVSSTVGDSSRRSHLAATRSNHACNVALCCTKGKEIGASFQIYMKQGLLSLPFYCTLLQFTTAY